MWILLQEWEVDLSSELVPSPATKAYTDFLDSVATNEVGPEQPKRRHGRNWSIVCQTSAHIGKGTGTCT